jgi:hypothetical protein
MRWTRQAARDGNRRSTYRVLARKFKGKIHVGRPRRGWNNNIKMEFRDVGLRNEDSIDLFGGELL